MNDFVWKTIDTMFKDNKNFFVKHHLESYNQFFKEGLVNIFKDKNPLKFFKEKIPETGEFKYQFEMYFGGKNTDKIYYGKPIIYDDLDEREHYMYPNEARLRNMTYGFTIHYDVEIDYTIYLNGEKEPHKETVTIEKIFLGRFPIMINSDYCLLKGLEPEVRFNMGECRNDLGGYFIIDGKEKSIMPQEGRADNMMYIREHKSDDMYSHSAEIRSVSEDASKPNRTLSVRLVRETPSKTNNHIVVNIPQVRAPIPLFILMRALGVISDKEIIETCLLESLGQDENDIKNYSYIELFRPSIHDAGPIFSQYAALKYIKELLKYKSDSAVLEILMLYFLPHIGEMNFKQKAYYLGYMVKRLLDVSTGNHKPTDRDSYSFKRIETPGVLLYKLFQEYYNKQFSHIFRVMDKEFFYKGSKSGANIYNELNFKNLVGLNEKMIFIGDDKITSRIVEQGFRKAFKGDWGSDIHTKRSGIVQDFNRLSFFSALCQLRKTNLHLSADGAKVRGPRFLNATQYGLLCPIHSPDGGNCGLHKHLSASTYITKGESGRPFFKYIKNISKTDKTGNKHYINVKLIEECSINQFTYFTKIFVNGCWFAMTDSPQLLCELMRSHKRNNIIDPFTSIYFNIKLNEIHVSTDAGRPCRPLFYKMYNGKWSQTREFPDKLSWKNYTKGFKNDENEYFKTQKTRNQLVENASIVEFIDTLEAEGIMIGHSTENIDTFNGSVTHMEIHPSLILSVMANQIIFPEHNPYPRNAFSCGQGKQGVSVYHSNYRNRVDKTALFLNYGQSPLTKSRMYSYATNEQHPYGENTIVAIMCYSGFNVEDAVILNQGSIDRGLFNTTKFAVYETFEESVMIGGGDKNTKIMNVYDKQNNVVGFKSGYDYSKLDDNGLIREGETIDEKTILIGKAIMNQDSDELTDDSIKPKKGEVGIIDKAFITETRAGTRIAKIRIRSIRKPAIGDKFCSRAGQKGTIGIILPETDMPTSADGIKPDIIVNPHAMPSRMTIGHIVETITSKLGSIYGGFGDCTAFTNKGPQHEIYGKYLMEAGMEKYGQEILYNGMTGEQLETDIYFGPTYYLRLKHMPKDKINYRARGPRDMLTRQTVAGRANDGGLRLGEMDRDCVVAHGLSHFVSETLMKRGDEFKVAICNKTGCIAAYNPSKNIFLSPFADGPIKFENNIENEVSLINVNKFGRDFSIVNIPYAFKLLMQELQAMNVQMRLITEDNIDQLMSLGNGAVTEIKNLTHNKKANFKSVKEETQRKQTSNKAKAAQKEFKRKVLELEEETPKLFSTDQYSGVSWAPNLFSNEGDWSNIGSGVMGPMGTGMMGPMGTGMMGSMGTGMMTSMDDGNWDDQMQSNPLIVNQPTEQQNTKTPDLHDKAIFDGGEGHIFELPEWDEDPDNMLYGIRKDDGAEVFLPLSEINEWKQDPDYEPNESDSEEEEEKPPLIIDKDDADIKKDITLLNVEEIKDDEKKEDNDDNSGDKKSVKMDT
tara:strand:+ start:1228 stop:5688 length:4461 start_codon:yes stop_codon:yes gene_type:complete